MSDFSKLPDEIQQLDIELNEEPAQNRQDFASTNFICDENGDLEKSPAELEIRGVTSYSHDGKKKEKQSAELWSSASVHKLSVVAKLKELGRLDLSDALETCHTEETCRVCNGCRKVSIFLNRCERHYCPECAPRLSRERRESVEWWAKEIREPKHVVLTVRNSDQFSKPYVQWFKQCFRKLRARKLARNWKGGFYRLEVTNEGKGWHLHLHALVDAGWIDARKLSEVWAEIVGQDLAIVKVKDVHNREYLHEVTKYSVKGSELAKWPGAQIAQFVDAMDGVKTFGVFGSLYGKRTEWREFLDQLQAGKVKCACGCEDFRILSPNELAWETLHREGQLRPSMPNAPASTPDFPNLPLVEGAPRRTGFPD